MADRDELKAAAQAMINATNQRAAYVASGTEDQVEFAVERFWAAHDALQKAVNAAPIQPVATQEDAGKVQGEESKRMQWVLRQIVSALPSNKDWLDPALEREAKYWGNAMLESAGNVQAVQISGDVDSALQLLRAMIKTEKPLSNFSEMTTLTQSPHFLIKNIQAAISLLETASQPSNAVQDARPVEYPYTLLVEIAEHIGYDQNKGFRSNFVDAVKAATVPPLGVPSDEQIEKVRTLIDQAIACGNKPMPDPIAHSHEAYARALHAVFCDMRFKLFDAKALLTTASNAGKEADK